MAISIWSEAQNRWLATGLILQGLGTLLTLGLLGWQIFHLQGKKKEKQYHEWVSDLTEVNPLKRLIAVVNLANLLEKQQLSSSQTKQLREYFRLMLSKENEMVVRQTVLKGLHLTQVSEL
ncbi:hypothetical protein AsFPU3_3111 [Aphanothece sacrum FPU3]|nr:hypothetical protein AsFPU3_3111 [Aphanothece sacrum FPU3]